MSTSPPGGGLLRRLRLAPGGTAGSCAAGEVVAGTAQDPGRLWLSVFTLFGLVIFVAVIVTVVTGGGKSGRAAALTPDSLPQSPGRSAPAKSLAVAARPGYHYTVRGNAPPGTFGTNLTYGTNNNDKNVAGSPALPWHGYLPYHSSQDEASVAFSLSDAGGNVSCRIKVVQPDGHVYVDRSKASGPDAYCSVNMFSSGSGWSGS